MANKEQLKSIIVSLGSLALQVRDQLAESHDQDTYTNLLDELKQLINLLIFYFILVHLESVFSFL